MQVILVDQDDNAIGVMDKMQVHELGKLHRAFSIFIINKAGNILLHKRAYNKYHSAGLWTNACCSHPQPQEDIKVAAQRRLKEEMGFTCDLKEIFSFVYKSEFENGLTEHEYDHVFIGEHDGGIFPDPQEVSDFRFFSQQDIKQLISEQPGLFSSWFLIAYPKVEQYLAGLSS